MLRQTAKAIRITKAYSLIVQAFSGKFFVKEKLKKTNASKQQGDKATINKPQLEIFADDVKCSHGLLLVNLMKQQCSTCNNAESLREAKALLMYAFSNAVIEASKYQN
jgi:Fe-S cluster assembly protein SufD